MTKTDRATLMSMKHIPTSVKLTGIALLSAEEGQLVINLEETGDRLKFGGDQPCADAEITVHDMDFARRSLAGGDIGFAESYMDGQWSTPDLTAVLEFFSANFDRTRKLAVGSRIVRMMNALRHSLARRNTRRGARKNIIAHYDLGNEFYSQWLDPSMTYSAGIYGSPNTSLEHAQHAKYTAVLDRLSAGPDSHILEIGCGWGGFAEVAARERGSRVTCLTLSDAQAEYARKRMTDAGLSDLVEIRIQDYRDNEGQYDGVASIEMFEAVGESYWPSYFQKIEQVLKPGGKAALQIITIRDELFERYRKRADFIQQFIFPGGMLPSERRLVEEFERADLKFEAKEMFGIGYARTLKEWHRRFDAAWERIAPLGFDETFRRMWKFYLSYCEAGFRNGRIDVGQFVLSKA